MVVFDRVLRFLPALVLPLLVGLIQAACAEDEYARFNGQGHLLRPDGYRTWVYVGGSVTPNEMNDGNAAFPEFHNVYMDPESYRKFMRTGEFPDETVMVKETLGIGGKRAESGKGYFMGEFIGLFAGVKDSKTIRQRARRLGLFHFPGDRRRKDERERQSAAGRVLQRLPSGWR